MTGAYLTTCTTGKHARPLKHYLRWQTQQLLPLGIRQAQPELLHLVQRKLPGLRCHGRLWSLYDSSVHSQYAVKAVT